MCWRFDLCNKTRKIKKLQKYRVKTYLIFDINGFASRLEKAESGVVNIGINKLCDNVIDELRSDFIMLLFTEKDLVCSFKNEFYFDSDSENYHRHNKSNKNSFARVSTFIFLLNLSNRNKQLFHVILVERQRINMTKDAPICQMANETD